MSTVLDSAWREYAEGIERLRKLLYSHPFARTPDGNKTVNYLFHQIQAVAFNVAIAPRQQSPRFFSHAIFEPATYTWTSPGSDYLYLKAFVDGSKKYRIWGKRSNSTLLFLQAMGGYWNDNPDQHSDLGVYNFDNFIVDRDGSFEAVASSEPVEGKNWIRLDSEKKNICLMVREVFLDWDTELPSELHIEPLESAVSTPPLEEAEFIERMQGALRFMFFTVQEWSYSLIENAINKSGYNLISDADLENTYSTAAGINPLGGFHIAAFDISENSALLIEIDQINARYWGIQLSDLWHQNLNFVDHQSSLNCFQAQADKDGVFRIILSLKDPGVHNWLDPVGVEKGGIDLRFLEPEGVPKVKCTLVNHLELRSILPKNTKYINETTRANILRRRRASALRRWGY